MNQKSKCGCIEFLSCKINCIVGFCSVARFGLCLNKKYSEIMLSDRTFRSDGNVKFYLLSSVW